MAQQFTYCWKTWMKFETLSSVLMCSFFLFSYELIVVVFDVLPPAEQKPKTRRQPSAQCRWPGWPSIFGLPRIFGHHVWGRGAHGVHPREPGSCQSACCALDKPDEGPLARYINLSVLKKQNKSSMTLAWEETTNKPLKTKDPAGWRSAQCSCLKARTVAPQQFVSREFPAFAHRCPG